MSHSFHESADPPGSWPPQGSWPAPGSWPPQGSQPTQSSTPPKSPPLAIVAAALLGAALPWLIPILMLNPVAGYLVVVGVLYPPAYPVLLLILALVWGLGLLVLRSAGSPRPQLLSLLATTSLAGSLILVGVDMFSPQPYNPSVFWPHVLRSTFLSAATAVACGRAARSLIHGGRAGSVPWAIIAGVLPLPAITMLLFVPV